MKCNYRWLKEWVNVDLSAQQMAEQLSKIGLTVDAIEPVGEDFTGIVVGEVLSIVKHPDADRLRVCCVDVGEKEPLTIVCGASNVCEGMKVPVALIGAVLPGNFQIKKSKLRGVESFGMLCSAKELGLAEESQGLLDLSSDAVIGQDVRDVLQLDDMIFDVELTPNRGDCLSVLGIARELSAVNNIPLKTMEIKAVPAVTQDVLSIFLDASDACPKYLGRVIRGINSQAKTPLWLSEKLRRCGLRSISPVVDVTNYVMLEMGQPMHAFDLSALLHDIHVRFAKEKEMLTLLNGDQVEFNKGTLLIADSEKPLAVAGIIGGADSAVSKITQDIFLESAYFDPISLAGRARTYGLHTDSSYRFERGVDPAIQRKAIERATQLLLDIVGGAPGPVVEKVEEQYFPSVNNISFRPAKVEKLLGVVIPTEKINDLLTRLGVLIDQKNETVWSVQVPTYRFDLSIEVDLIEEVARLYGYDQIPVLPCIAELSIPKKQVKIENLKRVRELLKARDYREIITYSFIDANDQKLLDPDYEPEALLNPIAQNMSVMRTNLWPGLINVLIYNLHRQQARARLFESGMRFRRADGILFQENVLSGLIYGSVVAEQWGEKSRLVDFYDIKGDLESLFMLTGEYSEFVFKPGNHHALHPGQTAELFFKDRSIGYVGAIHPGIAQKQGVSKNIYLFEVLLDPLLEFKLKLPQLVSKYPSIRRDLAIWIDEHISVGRVEEIVRHEAGSLLKELVVFDVYQNIQEKMGRKSIALGLTLQDLSRTLKDKEVSDVFDQVIKALELKVAAKLRD